MTDAVCVYLCCITIHLCLSTVCPHLLPFHQKLKINYLINFKEEKL